MLMLRRFTSLAIESSGAETTCASGTMRSFPSAGAAAVRSHRIPCRSSAAAHACSSTSSGRAGMDAKPAGLAHWPISPVSTQLPSGYGSSRSRVRPPSTVRASIRTSASQPAGTAQTTSGGSPSRRLGRTVKLITFSCRLTAPTGGA